MRKREKGAVTIFSMIVLFSIVLLGGLFIDASRILLARQMVRSAMNSAARSALSYYSTELVGDFGLYGVTEEDAKTQFERYFINNLTLSQNDGFHLYDFTMSDHPTTVTVSEPLSDEDAFTDQVAEYSKYRAGINLTIGVIDKVSMLFGENGAANKAMDATDDAKKAFDKLKNDAKSFGSKITETLKENVKKTANEKKEQLIKDIKNGVEQGALDFGEEALQQVLKDASGQVDAMKNDKNTYDKTSEEANKQISEAADSMTEQEYYNEETGKWETVQGSKEMQDGGEPKQNTPGEQAEQMIQNAQSEVTAAQSRLQQNMTKIKEKAAQAQLAQQDAEELDAQLAELLAQVESCEQAYEAAKQAVSGQREETLSELKTEIEEKEENLKNLLTVQNGHMPDVASEELEYYEKLFQNAEQLKLEISKINEQLENLYEQQREVQSGDVGELSEKMKQEEQKLNQAKSAYEAKKSEKEDAEQKVNTLLDEIEDLYDSMAMAEDKLISGEIDYELEVDEQTQEESNNAFITAWNKLMDTLNSIPNELGKNAQYVSEGSGNADISKPENTGGGFGVIEDLMNTCTAITEIFTDEDALLERCYFVEYALDKYTFVLSQTQRPAHHFKIGEVEYIIDGNDVQGVNIGTVVGKIFTLRLVINFVDDLIHTQSPEPLSRALIALGRALLDTAKDMVDLITQGECGLCPSFDRVKLTYSDHLRLQLLLNSNEEIAGRMQTMIDRTMDIKEGKHVDQLYTRIDATAEVKIDLIMLTLPMFGQMMPGQDVIQDGMFTIRESVSLGY